MALWPFISTVEGHYPHVHPPAKKETGKSHATHHAPAPVSQDPWSILHARHSSNQIQNVIEAQLEEARRVQGECKTQGTANVSSLPVRLFLTSWPNPVGE
jgi:hypothetical protein